PFLKNAIPEFCMIGGGHLIRIYDHHIISDDVMRKIIGIVDAYIVTEITADDRAVIQPNRASKIMELEIVGGKLTDPHQPEKLTVLHQLRRKVVGYQDIVPVGRR